MDIHNVRRGIAGAGLALLLLTPGASAQRLGSADPRPADVGSLDGIIAAFYDVISVTPGGRVDWARDSTLYLAGVTFTIMGRTPADGWQPRRVDHGTYAGLSACAGRPMLLGARNLRMRGRARAVGAGVSPAGAEHVLPTCGIGWRPVAIP
jgi:hypothetical protein